jgi:hypothetical protein
VPLLLVPLLYTALGGWREPLALADWLEQDPRRTVAAEGVALRERMIPFLTERLRAPHPEPTNRLRYWLAYADDRAAASAERGAAAPSTPQQKLDLFVRTFLRLQQAALLTHQFGLEDPREWDDEARALAGPTQFIARYVDRLEQTPSNRERAWGERIWLARVDPSTVADVETRFARERPGDSFNAEWARTIEGGMSLPEGTLTTTDGESRDLRRTLEGRWTALLIWSPSCEACRGDLERFDALARQFTGRVFAITAEADAEAVRLFLADHGWSLPAAVVPASVVEQLRASPGSRFLVSPGLRFAELRGVRWEDDLRRALSVDRR